MTDAPEPWHPSAAYLYVPHLDGPALAWEYLRRNPDYCRDWWHHRRRASAAAAAHRWGLCRLENPRLDARDAYPAWCPDPAGAIQLHPDLAPAAGAVRFDLWCMPGHKHLFHDGQHLSLTVWLPGGWRRVALAPTLEHGMPYVHALHHGHPLPRVESSASSWAWSRARLGRAALLELHTLQTLDGTLAGATLRAVAEALVGRAAVAADWHADGALRARVRRLAQRGVLLMRGGYWRLLPYPPIAQGRLRRSAKRP